MGHPARAHLESLLRTRKLDVTLTSAAPWREPVFDAAPLGIAAVDEALGGGLRRGHVSEVVGARSSGRTTLMCRALAGMASRGEMTALIDTSDRFDPVSAAAAGVDLSRVLWLRARGDAARALKAMNLVLQAGGFGLAVFDLADVHARDLRQFPATTWMRLARAIEGTQTVALLVGAERLARSPGGVTLALGAPSPRWAGAGDRARILRGVDVQARVVTAWG
jgi:recombination protein RecA